ncbi:MAG TPA: hypothetical protein VD907_04340 [Verrucomicrobiae bacterium]|nr:hypothetical protein [Verrucomicrobiae bacterium]
MKDKNNNQVVVMSISAVLGGLIGWFVGTYWLSPAILIPIGVVIGIAVGMAATKAK